MLVAMLLATIQFAHALSICLMAILLFNVRKMVGILKLFFEIYPNLYINV